MSIYDGIGHPQDDLIPNMQNHINKTCNLHGGILIWLGITVGKERQTVNEESTI
jgi:hypothetical protein